ncbi:hypothetical protein Tco_0785866, partial [Tanacetum coccineum]
IKTSPSNAIGQVHTSEDHGLSKKAQGNGYFALILLSEEAQRCHNHGLPRCHSTFQVSNLKKCLSDEPLAILLDEIHIDDKLHFIEEPVEIMDRDVKRLKQSHIPIIKVQWNSRRGPKFTWEREDQFQKKYPHLLTKTTPSTSVAS